MKSRVLWLGVFLSLSLSVLAQDTASITGTVTDPSGAAVVSAQVTVSSPERGINRTTTTNDSGDFLVAGLSPGSIDVAVTAKGFKKYEAKGVILGVGQKARADVALQVGTSTTEVEVEGTNVAQVETQSSDLTGSVTGKQISQLQLNGRNFAQLATLVPGVTNQSGQDEGTVGVYGNVAFSVNGGRTEYNNWELDGGDNMDNGSNTTLNVYPSLEAIAEFKVLTSNYGAQYGRNGSGTVEVETKSGTSQFHGNAYEFLRNDAFNAPTFFQGGIVPPYKKNDYGYTIGGPVYIPGLYNKDKQKTFFFWSEEWRRDRVPATTFNTPVPTLAERAGDFSADCPGTQCPVQPQTVNAAVNPNAGQPFPGNQVPVDPNAAGLLQLIPQPSNGSANFRASPIQATSWREELVRIDHNLTDKQRLTFRFIHDSWNTVTPTPLWTNATSWPTVQTAFTGPGVGLVTRLTSTFAPTLLNEFVFSYTADHIGLVNQGAWKRPPGFNIPGLFNNGFGGGRLPGITFSGGPLNGLGEDPGYIPNGPYNSNPTYTYRDNMTKILGKHNLQFGAYFVAAQKNELSANAGPSASPGGSVNGFLVFSSSATSVTTGNPFADLLMGQISSFGQQNQQLKYYNRYKIVEPYFQDDWHATSRLTLNLGLRLSLFGTYRERYHQAYNFEPGTYVPGASFLNPDGTVGGNVFNGLVQCGVGKAPAGCITGHLFNPAPRIGFAWDPTGNGKTAVRGGYGIFFEHTNGNEGNTESLENSPPGVQVPVQSNIAGYNNIGNVSGIFPLGVAAIPTKAVWPYSQQWHFDIQRQVFRNTVATVSYVGSKGTHLTRVTDLNQLRPVPLSLNPFSAGQPLTSTICGTVTPTSAMVNGNPITNATVLANLNVACGASANPYRPFQGFSDITHFEDAASSNYNGFEASLRRSVGALQLSFAYTYSHSIDDSSSRGDAGFVDSYNPAGNRASSNFDQRHVLNASWVYDLPFFKSPGVANKLLGGWEYSGIMTFQTGTPFNVVNGGGTGIAASDNAGVGNGVSTSHSYPDVAGSPKSGIPSASVQGFGPLLFNPGAFVAPRGLTFGDAGRNPLKNPQRTNFDMAVFKHFRFTESLALEFRAEAFNVFNHREWQFIGGAGGSGANNSPVQNFTNSTGCYGGPNNSSGDASCLGNSFLHIGAVHNARILQLGAKFIF